MNPESVLKEDDKKTRFRKHISKQLEDDLGVNLPGGPNKRRKINVQSLPAEVSSQIKLKFKRKNSATPVTTADSRVETETIISLQHERESNGESLGEATDEPSTSQGDGVLPLQSQSLSVDSIKANAAPSSPGYVCHQNPFHPLHFGIQNQLPLSSRQESLETIAKLNQQQDKTFARTNFQDMDTGFDLSRAHSSRAPEICTKSLLSTQSSIQISSPDSSLTQANKSPTFNDRNLTAIKSSDFLPSDIEYFSVERTHGPHSTPINPNSSVTHINKSPSADDGCGNMLGTICRYDKDSHIAAEEITFPTKKAHQRLTPMSSSSSPPRISSNNVSSEISKFKNANSDTVLELSKSQTTHIDIKSDRSLMPPPTSFPPLLKGMYHSVNDRDVFLTSDKERKGKFKISTVSQSTKSEPIQIKDIVSFMLCLGRNPSLSSFKTRTKSKFEHFIKTWYTAVQRIDLKPELIAGIVKMHQDKKPMGKELIMDYVVSLSTLLKDFAIQQQEFGSLPLKQQKDTLLRGAQCLTQYFIGQYFAAIDGESQIKWLTSFYDSLQIESVELKNIHYLGFEEFNKLVGLFTPGLEFSLYLSQVEAFRSWKIPSWFNGLIAAICLFFPGDGINKAFCGEDMELLVKAAIPGIKLTGSFCTSLTKLCESMFKVFESHLDGTAIDNISLTSVLSEVLVPFSESEEIWLNKRLAIFDQAFNSVNFGFELVREYIMYSLSVPLSKRFASCTTVIFTERLKRALLKIPEFHCLRAKEQAIMLQANVMPAVSVYISRLVCFSDAEEQMRFVFGPEDRQMYANQFEGVMGGRNKLSMITEKSLNLGEQMMPEDEYMKYGKTCRNIGTFVCGGNRFHELMMLLMLSNDAVRSPDIEVVSQRFYTALQRKYANSLCGSSNDWNGGGDKRAASVLPPSWAKVLTDVKYVSETAFKYFVLPELIRREKEATKKMQKQAEFIQKKEDDEQDQE